MGGGADARGHEVWPAERGFEGVGVWEGGSVLRDGGVREGEGGGPDLRVEGLGGDEVGEGVEGGGFPPYERGLGGRRLANGRFVQKYSKDGAELATHG